MLERKVENFLKKKSFQLHHKRILVGVSGGPDSLALLHYLVSKRDEFHIYVVAAHVDHMFRGEESEREAKFVEAFCKENDIPFEMGRLDVPLYIKETGRSSQVAARECRYEFFKNILLQYNLPYLALGHHGDDQIETILMRLTRGATGKARGGIPFSRPFEESHIIRPFLCLNSADIEDYCDRYRLDPRRDPSNEKELYSRNRFRKRLLPFLKSENPQVHEQFLRFSEQTIQDEDYLMQLAEEGIHSVIRSHTKMGITLEIDALERMPLPLQRRVIQLILNYLYKERPASLSSVHIESIQCLIGDSHPSGTLSLPHALTVIRSYRQCHFQFESTTKSATPFYYEVGESTVIDLPSGDSIRIQFLSDDEQVALNAFTIIIYIAEENLPLIIRNRKNGDTMKIKGMDGSKKIKKLFIDEKVPLHEREQWPIVTDAKNRVIWVPKLRRSGLYHIKDTEIRQQRKILLTYVNNDLLGGISKNEK